MNSQPPRVVSNYNLPQKKLSSIGRLKERFARIRPALIMVEERVKAKPQNQLELNLRLFDAFKLNNASEMTRLIRAGARVDSIEDNIRSEERRTKQSQ